MTFTSIMINFQPWRIYCFGCSNWVAWSCQWCCSSKFCRTIWRWEKGKWNFWRNSSTKVSPKAIEGSFPACSSWIFILAGKATSSGSVSPKKCMLLAIFSLKHIGVMKMVGFFISRITFMEAFIYGGTLISFTFYFLTSWLANQALFNLI